MNNALLKIAEYYKSKINIKYTVAVTGSVGKSTTVKFLSKIVGEKYKVHSPIKNFNNHIGVPLTILAAPSDTEALILEMGMNHEDEIAKLSKSTHPNIGIITSIGTAHIGNLGTRENIAKAKLELLEGMDNGIMLLPKNEPLLSRINNAFYVSRNDHCAHFSLDDQADGMLTLHSILGDIKSIPFFDKREHLLFDLAMSLAAAQLMDIQNNSIINGATAINESDLRQRFIKMRDFTVFDDSYNASLESIVADLRFISTYNSPKGALLADVLELGPQSATIHEQIGYEAAHCNPDHLYLYGNFAECTAKGAIRAGMDPKSIYVNSDINSPEITITQIMKNHFNGELILFKGSHKMDLSKIADAIKEEESNE